MKTCKCGQQFKDFKRNGISIHKLCYKCRKKKIKTPQQIVEKLRKKCVALAKEIAKKRDNYKCQYCGIGKPQRQVHSHHIFHEGIYKAMSADPDNLITICASHHQGGVWMKSHSRFNFHNSPRESTEWLIENYPDLYEALKQRSKQTIDLTEEFWKNKLGELKNFN